MKTSENKKLLGRFTFVSRTFEGHFEDTPFVLDMDANLYVGPADHLSRDEHAVIEVVYQFLKQTGKIERSVTELLRNRLHLLEAFSAFDTARVGSEADEFKIFLFGTYDAEPLHAQKDDDMPAGPCGKTVNEIKRRMYSLCKKADTQFEKRELGKGHKATEARFIK